MNIRKLLSFFVLVVLTTVFWMPDIQAAGDLNGRAYTIGVGYSKASFVIDTANPDSDIAKIVLYYGKTATTMIPKDSLTSTITDPDTIAKGVGTFENGTTYYWYVRVEDSTTTIYYPSDKSALTFTTTNYIQTITTAHIGYSTAWFIGWDTTGASIPNLTLDSLRLHLDKVNGATYNAHITTVTYPDTFKVTGLDEGATYYWKTIAYKADSGIVDTTSALSFATTDLTVTLTEIALALDSIGVVCDTNGIIVDSLIFQWGAGLVTANADTLTTVTGIDTFYVINMVLGGVYSYRIIAFLPDSSAIETTSTSTYTMLDPWAYQRINLEHFGGPTFKWKFDLTNASDTLSTELIDITGYKSVKIAAILLGEDDAAAYDSACLVVWTYDQLGAKVTAMTLISKDPDTVTFGVQPILFDPAIAADTAEIKAKDFFQYMEVAGYLTCFADSIAKASNTIGHRPIYVTLEFQKE